MPWVGIDALMVHTGRSRLSIVQEFETNAVFKSFEIGTCDDRVFIRELIDVFDLKLDTLEAKHLWQHWVEPPFKNTQDVLHQLKKTHTTACLSNTNALHWSRLEEILPLTSSFHHAYASHLLGAAKPDARCYQLALDDMGEDPQNVVFFDDTPANVEAAQALGMKAHLVDRSVGVISVLKTLEFI